MQAIEVPDDDMEPPDSSDRIRDFWDRHGGPSAKPSQQGEILPGAKGWSEVYAADGYTLRCDWSKIGSQREGQYVERRPPP
jgi:hypothetical protein